MSSSVRFQSPDLHFSKPLSTEVRLSSERLLVNERVRSCGSCMNLFFCYMNELQHVHVTDHHRIVEGFSRSSVSENHFSIRVVFVVSKVKTPLLPFFVERSENFVFFRPFENRCCKPFSS